MIDNLILILMASVCAIPVGVVLMNLGFDIYFAKKMRYQRQFLHDLDKEVS